MSLNVIELDHDRISKPIFKSQGPMGRLAEITAAADDAKATYELWHAKLQSAQEQCEKRELELNKLTRLHSQKTTEVNNLLNAETSLNEKLGNLNAQRELLMRRQQDINSRFLQEQGRLEQTREQLGEAENYKVNLESQVASATRLLMERREEHALQDLRSEDLKVLLQNAIDEVTRQQSRIVVAQSEVVRFENRQQELTISVARLEVSVQDRESRLRLEQERLNSLEEAGSRVTAHVLDLNGRYQALEKDFKQLTQQRLEAESSLNLTRRAIMDERSCLQELRQAVEQTNQVRVTMESTLVDLEGQSNATAASLQDLRAESTRQDQALTALLVQRGESESALIKLRADEESATVALTSRREELARSEEKLGIALNECTEAIAELADLGRAVRELEDREAAAAQQIQQYTDELVAQADRRLLMEGQISAMELALADLGEQHCSLGAEIVVLVNTRQSTAETLQTCLTDLTATEQRLETTRTDCLAAQTRLSFLTQSIQERQEDESMLGERIHILQQQTQQMETQIQEQSCVLETVHQQRIEAKISLQLITQNHEEVGIRLESGRAEIAAAAARLQQTLEHCHHADERKHALDHELENLSTRQSTQEAILGEVEAQIFRRKTEREVSIVAADQAREELADLSASVTSVRKELSEQQASFTETTSKLSDLQTNVHDTEGSLNATRAILAGEELKLEATRSALATVEQELTLAHEIKVSLEALSANQAKLASIKEHLGGVTRQVEAAAERRTQMDAILNDTTQQLAIATAHCDAVSQQETETRQRLAQMGMQEKELRQEIDILTTGAQKERGIYEELRSINTEARRIQDQESAEVAAKLRATSEHLSSWHGQMASLEDWQERMNNCLSRQMEVEPDSLEARNCNQEISMALTALRYIMDRLGVTKNKIGTLSRLYVNGSGSTDGVSASEESPSTAADQLNKRIQLIREDIQREETRFKFLRQKSISLAQRPQYRRSKNRHSQNAVRRSSR